MIGTVARWAPSWRSRPRLSRWLVPALLTLGGALAPLAGQTMDVPLETQIPLFLKLLNFDRNLHGRVDSVAPGRFEAPVRSGSTEVLRIGILFQSGNRESLRARDLAVALMRAALKVVDGFQVRPIPIDLDREEIVAALEEHDVTVIYVTPLRAVDVRSIAVASRAARVRSITGVTSYVDQGLAIGVGLQGELPQIIINLPAARLEGADYPAQLLKLARVLQ